MTCRENYAKLYIFGKEMAPFLNGCNFINIGVFKKEIEALEVSFMIMLTTVTVSIDMYVKNVLT